MKRAAQKSKRQNSNHKNAPHRPDICIRGFIQIPRRVLDSPAYLSLPYSAQALLGQIVSRFYGNNNGRIRFSHAEAMEALGGASTNTVVNGFALLMEHGLIDVETEGDWYQRMAREYRITFISSGDGPPYKRATNDYLNWQPKSPARDFSHCEKAAKIGDSASVSAVGTEESAFENAAEESPNPRNSGNSENPLYCKKESPYKKPYLPAPAKPDAPTRATAQCEMGAPDVLVEIVVTAAVRSPVV